MYATLIGLWSVQKYSTNDHDTMVGTAVEIFPHSLDTVRIFFDDTNQPAVAKP